ncbi:MAG TPA: Crp/Fnr family transcriptional regulator [Pyrinomonadaceae bacterium]|nr:Crp/Fnr family transcriptional regulator [Pyrinomonadaceae bacterium]
MPYSITSDKSSTGVRVAVPPSQNKLLTHLLAADADFLLPQIRIVKLNFNDIIYEYGDSIDDVFFPLDSIVSALSIMEDGTTIEISMAGNEGVVGLSALLGGGMARHWTRMCIGGTLARLSATALDRSFISNENSLKYIMHSYSSLITQVSQRAVCNARHTVLERLACWLLMIHDRVGGQNLRLTQEAIASRLGARRAGITVAAGMLQSVGAIEYRRGQLHIRDREGLERAVCECYPMMKAEYEGTQTGKGLAKVSR